MRDSKPKSVVTSTNLDAYKLPKDVRAILDRTDKMRAYMQLGGKTPPNEVRLFRHDWLKIDAASVFYKGHAIVPHNERPPSFSLDATA